MGLFEIKAFKCEWCGRLFESDKNYHETECKNDPSARSCIGCIFSSEIKSDYERKLDACYCPRADKVFKYPHDKYCPSYKRDPNYISYKPKV